MADRRAERARGAGIFRVFAAGLATLSVIGLLGVWSGWADIVNQFAPIWFGLAASGLLVFVVARGWRHSRWSGIVLLFAITVQGALTIPELLEGARPTPRDARLGPAFSVLTFNVWNDATRRAAMIDRIVASGADVVTLQEALGLERVSSPELAAAYPYRATCDDWWGCEILILSKRPILDHHYEAPEPTGSGGPLWTVWVTTTASDGHPVRVLSTHFAWPIPPAFRQDQVEDLREIVRGLGDTSLIVTGDCNADGSSFALRRQDAELPSLTRRTRGVFSWPAIVDGTHWPAPFPFLAIDQLYASRDWRTLDVTRLPRSGSDHYPILVRLARDR
jgi:endonuclease/exonuclease/phosphatase (EEP) superfamily protein YafD